MKTTKTIKLGLRAGIASILWIATCFQLPSVANARDMQGRLGLGYNAQFTTGKGGDGIPAVSFKYGTARDIAFAGVVGIDTSNPSTTLAALKFFKNIFFETNLNFYFMASGGYLAANSKSGLVAQGGFGTEFFIPGLESLGFSVETGATFDNVSGDFVFKTLGVSFLSAGIHFYF